MKIVQQTPTQLILREQRPWWLVGLVLGSWLVIGLYPVFAVITWLFVQGRVLTFWEGLLSVFFLIWGISLTIFVLWIGVNSPMVVTYSFDKILGRMTLKQRSLLSTQVTERSIQEISGVEVQESRSTGSYGTVSISYKVRLVLVSGRSIALISMGMSLRGAQKIAECVSAILDVNNYGLEGAPKLAAIELRPRTPQEELAHWQAAIRVNPNAAEAHAKLGVILYKQGHKKEAKASIKQAIKLFIAQGKDEQAMGVQLMWRILRWNPHSARKVSHSDNFCC